MKVKDASDLHLESYDNSVFLARNPFKVAGDVLVLAGDVLPLWDFNAYSQHRFFDWCAANYREPLLIPGNHEYYKDDIGRYPSSWQLQLIISLGTRSNGGVFLEQTEPGSEWYKLTGNIMYMRIIGESPIEAFDPDGGPYVSAGSKVGNHIVMEIRQQEGALMVKLK